MMGEPNKHTKGRHQQPYAERAAAALLAGTRIRSNKASDSERAVGPGSGSPPVTSGSARTAPKGSRWSSSQR